MTSNVPSPNGLPPSAMPKDKITALIQVKHCRMMAEHCRHYNQGTRPCLLDRTLYLLFALYYSGLDFYSLKVLVKKPFLSLPTLCSSLDMPKTNNACNINNVCFNSNNSSKLTSLPLEYPPHNPQVPHHLPHSSSR